MFIKEKGAGTIAEIRERCISLRSCSHWRRRRILAFQEKPNPQEALSDVVNTGVYLLEPEIFELIPVGFYDFGRELFPKLLELQLDFYG